ncbi:MAG: hypothetical protein O2913_08325 [Chloroflexi bacterium]|nr:hypothetical protein [Chloroflexota bacterium]
MSNTRRIPGWLLPVVAMAIALVAITLWAAGSFSAQAAPDAQNEGMITLSGTGLSIGTTDAPASVGWETIDGLSGTLHKAQWKDLVMDVSLEYGIYTDTQVKSKGGTRDTSNATASVKVRVLLQNVDGGPIYSMTPNGDKGIVYCSRSQTLSAVFQGLIADCIDAGGHIFLNDDCLEPEEVQLILDTTNANAFNFIQEDLPQGDYMVTVQGKLDASGSDQVGSFEARAAIGWGSAILSEVRFVKN